MFLLNHFRNGHKVNSAVNASKWGRVWTVQEGRRVKLSEQDLSPHGFVILKHYDICVTIVWFTYIGLGQTESRLPSLIYDKR